MVRIYTTSSCSSCRKAKKWLDEIGVEYIEKNVMSTKITRKDIYSILKHSENGFDDIISTRSKIIKENNYNLEEFSINELVDLVIENPTILRRPIIVDEKIMQVGYNSDEIRAFLPKRDRQMLMCDDCKGEECNYIEELKQKLKRIGS